MFKKTFLTLVILGIWSFFAQEALAGSPDNRGISSITFGPIQRDGQREVLIHWYAVADTLRIAKRFDTRFQIRVNGNLVATIIDSLSYSPPLAKGGATDNVCVPCAGGCATGLDYKGDLVFFTCFPGGPGGCGCEYDEVKSEGPFSLRAGDLVAVALDPWPGSVVETYTADDTFSQVVAGPVPASTGLGRILLALLLAATAAGVVWKKLAVAKGGDLA